jgi:hypothetical protein
MKMRNNNLAHPAAAFARYAQAAANNGGFFVSSAGGTWNVAAGIIARATGREFSTCLRAIIRALDRAQFSPDWAECGIDAAWRWDVRTIARAALYAGQRESDVYAIDITRA